MYEISVNLATYNRAEFLETCLESLCKQTLDPSRYEICVINNACTDNTPQVVAKIARLYPNHRVFSVYEPVPGLSRARNCGIKATSAPLIAHVDDDGSVDPEWLEQFVTRFAALGPEVAAIGGEIDPVWEQPKPPWLNERMEWFLTAGSGLGRQARFLTDTECTSECNSCYRRDALEKVGGFPEELGRVGACLLSGEQVVQMNIRRNGGQLFFDPQIKLHHFIHANRMNPAWFRQRMFWQGVSKLAIRNYLVKCQIAVPGEDSLHLPLAAENWNFLSHETTENLETSMMHFHSLGFVLALTGLLPIETVSPSTAQGVAKNVSQKTQDFYQAMLDKKQTPLWARHGVFWQGINDFKEIKVMPSSLNLPLHRGDWNFINNGNEQPTIEQLERLRCLGYVLAEAGFL